MSKFAKEVNFLIRRDRIKDTAASCLAENISKTPNLKVLRQEFLQLSEKAQWQYGLSVNI